MRPTLAKRVHSSLVEGRFGLRSRWALAGLLLFALAIRLILLHGPMSSLRHGSAAYYGSAAIGLATGNGLTTSASEMSILAALKSNLGGDYRQYFATGERMPFTEFLPAPAYLLAGFWKLTGVHSFAPLIYFQALVDSLLIMFMCWFLRPRHMLLAWVFSFLLCIDPVSIRPVLTMGYDFWPRFACMAMFILVGKGLESRRPWPWLLVAGIAAGWAGWCRSLTTFLPFFVGAAALAYMIRQKRGWKESIVALTALLVPVLLSISALSALRYHQTGSYRPTRAVFWHSFCTGIGQFSNPYGLEPDDQSVFRWAVELEPELRSQTVAEWVHAPNSLFERTLREAGIGFIKDHPMLFMRNTVYRALFVLSPALYQDASYIPPRARALAFGLGVLLLALWVLGMVDWYRTDPLIFALSAASVFYVIAAFSWFYVIGRVVLPVLFINLLAYCRGTGFLWRRWSRRTRSSGMPAT